MKVDIILYLFTIVCVFGAGFSVGSCHQSVTAQAQVEQVRMAYGDDLRECRAESVRLARDLAVCGAITKQGD